MHRQLALGGPVREKSLAEALGVPTQEITALLEDEQLKGWVFYDDENRVIGFRGLAVRKMPHGFEVEGRALYTWCAMDSLFIPEMLGKPAKVESRDPHTGTAITLMVTPDGVESVEPSTAVMSILIGDPEVLKTNGQRRLAGLCGPICRSMQGS